jgi:hypothetical protein
MPKSISYAIRSMYLGAVCYLAANVLSIARTRVPHGRGDIQFMLFLVTLVLCAVYCLLVSRIAERSKLARIILSILGGVSAINLVGGIGEVFKRFEADPLVVAFGLGAGCLQIVAVVLLFVPSSRNWFREVAG